MLKITKFASGNNKVGFKIAANLEDIFWIT